MVLARSEAPQAVLGGSSNSPAAVVVSEGVSEVIPTFSTVQVELVYRIVRVLSVVFSILFINMILIGSFSYMVTSNDDKVLAARKQIIIGATGTIFFICLYLMATAAILRLEAGV